MMESRNARRKFIQNWINEGDREERAEARAIPRAEAPYSRPAFEYQHVGADATVSELAERFIHVLKSFDSSGLNWPDWVVEVSIPDRDAVLYIRSESNEVSLDLRSGLCSTGVDSIPERLDARLSIPYEDLRLLTNLEVDFVWVMIRNKRIDNPDKPLIRPFADLLFGAYNLHHLKPTLRGSAIDSVYRTGKVVSSTGTERFVYPWGISADIGNVLYDLVVTRKLNRSLEIGFAYGLSALFMCQAHKDKGQGVHTAIDPCQSVEFESIGTDEIRNAGLSDHFRLIEEPDYEALPKLVQEGEKFELIFIDGLHMHDYVVLDFFYSDLLLAVNGLLVFDDCHTAGVSSAVAYFEENRNYKCLDLHSDHRVRVYRKLAEDSRSIADSNYHVEYVQKYYEFSRRAPDPGILAVGNPANRPGKPVAIIGVDGVFPKGKTVQQFWQSIRDGEKLYGRFAGSYLYGRRATNDTENHLVGGTVQSAFEFDPQFFAISRKEAEMMDPQLRHLLMSVYRAIEDSGHTIAQMSKSRVGVFIGSEGSDYNELHRERALQEGYFLNHAGSCIANRISYCFDFNGPSESINTMCSSGAVCIHRAVELLRSGDIDFAVVGAVKMNFLEEVFHSLDGLKITSKADSCYSFHRNSSGYIRSEGVVTMILTLTEKASERKDFVYANVREVSVNYNGKDGNSIFAPSKNGQKEVIKECYRKAGIPMTDVALIEAQGMGNEISDFVEFSAINEAYEDLLKERGDTSQRGGAPVVSTVKPLLGHMECVSALGALLKVVLSFRTGTLYRIPFLGDEDVNEKLEATSKHCRLLTATQTITGKRPMLAGVNSFGASGTNVHILMEESPVGERENKSTAKRERAHVLIVSAKSERSLDQYVEDIRRFLAEAKGEPSISELCYIFQARREHHGYRVMFHVAKAPEKAQIANLQHVLAQYTEKADKSSVIQDNRPGSVYYYKSAESSGTQRVAEDTALFSDGVSWLSEKAVDWNEHYRSTEFRKSGGLPTYPFDLRTYRLDRPGKTSKGVATEYETGKDVHPLLQRDTSGSGGKSYSSLFCGDEFFLSDHQVNKKRVFPAVAYLEMARAAVEQSAPASTAAAAFLELRDVVWLQPLVVSKNTEVRIVLSGNDSDGYPNGEIAYEISSRQAEGDCTSETLHCQGRAVFENASRPAPLDLKDLRGQMQLGVVEPHSLYTLFEDMGISYGECHRGIGAVYRGDHQLLAAVHLPDSIADTQDRYLLHPSVMDSALQSAIELFPVRRQGTRHSALPFALEKISVIAPCGGSMYAWVRLSRTSGEQGGVMKFDVDLCDPQGNVCAQMRGFTSRIFAWEFESLNTTILREPAEEQGANVLEGVSGSHLPGLELRGSNAREQEQSLRERSIAYFQNLIAKNLKADAQDLGPNKAFSEYGLDSVLVVQLTNRLREDFTDVTSTLFFEVQTIAGLADHFLENNKAELIKVVGKDVANRLGSASAAGAPQNGSLLQTGKRQPRSRAVSTSVVNPPLDVAIIGLSGRYPKSRNLKELWFNLSNGVNCVTEIPKSRWNWEEFYDPDIETPGTSYTKWGGFIDDIDRFDPLFFRISPVEAEGMDPQERIFLETCYHAIEDAGYAPGNLTDNNKVGVFVGVTNSMYTRAPDHFSFANRASYLFDFHGPSIAVDTACSSSLTAIHLALESLRDCTSGCAIAGGVNVIIDPVHHSRLAEMAALSHGSECRAFGEGADGFIDAEGVGVVVLKPLEHAERDRDQIYGIIKGSAINAGGKTNGYTVPNPNAQFSLVAEALERANLTSEQISYVEAHGTGTPLGDPIEIAGLTRAFRKTSSARQFCSIGSVKSNIGHCEAAAGIAGLTKVLLQLKYKQLVPSLHSAVSNKEIRFDETPFKVQSHLERWERPIEKVNGEIREIPRIAGVSSFGIGGANAHVIVQEYITPVGGSDRESLLQNAEVAVPLSARSREQLRQKAADLLEFIQAPEQEGNPVEEGGGTPPGTVDLPAVAYTLQVGREPMESRLGLLVSSVDELAEKLTGYLRGEQPAEGVYTGQIADSRDALSLFVSNVEFQETIEKWIAGRRLSQLVDLWVKGLELDWRRLYGDLRPRRVSLPTYPFARERYWTDPSLDQIGASGRIGSFLHPLVHYNTSDLGQQRYVTRLTGSEFFLSDHQVQGQKVLPAVVYLEMARAAIEKALPAPVSAAPELRNIVWGQPFIARETREISISLLANDRSELEFQICSRDEGEDQDVVHCRGQGVLTDKAVGADLDVEQLERQMGPEVLDSAAIYAALANMGLNLGSAHQAVTAVHRGEKQLLARLSLPKVVEEGRKDYLLHPSLMDGALHASIALVPDLDSPPRQPLLPFALESMTVISSFPEEMLAWIRYSPGSYPEDPVIKLDIDLCKRQGEVCVQLRGFSSRPIDSDSIAAKEQSDTTGKLLATPAWRPSSIVAPAKSDDLQYAQKHVLLCGVSQVDAEQLEQLSPRTHCLTLPSPEKHIARRFSECALACFKLVQRILEGRPDGKVLVQLVIRNDREQALLAGLSGLLKTANRENPRLEGQIILTQPAVTTGELAGQLQANEASPQDAIIKYEQGTRYVRSWQPVEDTSEKPPIPLKEQGVYLITGGLGGLGVLFAEEILKQAGSPKIVLAGRSALTAEKRAILDGLSADTGQVEYRQLNVCNLHQVKQLVTDIMTEYRQLNGIIHSAGVIADNYILRKTSQEFSQVLAPKVTGTFNLDKASQEIDLDFLVLFSSLASVTGNPGQADYATANGFMDHYASHRNELVRREQRRGHTLSMNWSFWQEGGMQIDQTTQELMREVTGVHPMRADTGIGALYRSLALRCGQASISEGQRGKMRSTMAVQWLTTSPSTQGVGTRGISGDDATGVSEPATTRENPDEALEKFEAYLSKVLSEAIKLPPHAINPRAPFENYGMDSILAMKLTSQLERTFGSLSKTLFFEYRTIRALAAYLLEAHPQIVEQEGRAGWEMIVKPDLGEPQSSRKPALLAGRKGRFIDFTAAAHDDIAIIGVSGKYPLADDLDEFWNNLKNGLDCVTEIPKDRWDQNLYFAADRKQSGRSYSKWGGFIRDVDKFDPLFFNISPKEAELMDPQERLFLETVWRTIEDAGYSKENISANRVGVYVGVMWGQYELFGADSAAAEGAMVPSSSYGSIANRVSYFFDFRGPSMAVDTMCSSSLTAIHLACEEIHRNGVDVAIAGGVNVSIHPNKYLTLSQGHFASSDGKCRSFGEGGDGYVPGEGVGAVLLKPLKQALQDGDQVYGVIKSSTINHGGKTHGYTVPNPNAQAEVIGQALQKARIDPGSLSYIECHGTGTSLGDPIEVTGLTKAFESLLKDGQPRQKQFCPIGSVKSNIGHLESAAGIVGVTKALLQFKHGQLVPSLHAHRLNPHIAFEESPFYVQTELTDWPRRAECPRRVGVSSFGAGGSNAHLIIEEHIATRGIDIDTGSAEAFVLSARDNAGLLRYVEKTVKFLGRSPGVSLRDVAYTSQVGRTPMTERLVVVASSLSDLKQKLSRWLAAQPLDELEGRHRQELEGVHYGSTRKGHFAAGFLIEGAAGRAFLEAITRDRDLTKIARLWTSGIDVEWPLLYQNCSPRRVSLPTYPLAKERYWVNTPVSLPAAPSTGKRQSVNAISRQVSGEKCRLHYRPQWTYAPIVASQREPLLDGPILILGMTDELFSAMKEALDERPADSPIIRVKLSDSFQETGTNQFTIDPQREEHFTRLVEKLKSRGQLPRWILHDCRRPRTPFICEQRVDKVEGDFYTLLYLCQALMKESSQGRAVHIISTFSSREPKTAPQNAAIGGFFKTVSLENPSYHTKLVEFRMAGNLELSISEKTSRLLDELKDPGWNPTEILYRHQVERGNERLSRYVREFTPFTPSEGDIRELPLKQHGVYMISGGLGGLGYIISDYLVKTFQSRLVLLGRSPLTVEREVRLKELTSHNTGVLYVRADVSKLEDTQRAVAEAKDRFGEINGVIHCAGVNRDSFIIRKAVKEVEPVLGSKMYGARNLDHATKRERLDIFVLFSSVTGAMGNVGQCDYAYANHFLDSFSEARETLTVQRKRSGRTLSINWPLWEEGGMAVAQDDRALVEEMTGLFALPAKQGIRYWEEFLRTDGSQCMALYGDSAKIEAYLRQRSGHPARGQRLSTGTRSPAILVEKVEDYLKTVIGEVIKLAPGRIGSQEHFDAFGIESVMVGQINARLQHDLGALPKTLLYQCENIQELAAYLSHEAHEALVGLFQMPDPLEEARDTEERVGHKAVPTLPATERPQPVAIIGLHGCYPGSENLDKYWENLRQGKDLISLVPSSRWNYEEFYDADPQRAADGKIYCKWGGFLDDVDKFDAHLFKISPQEAGIIDPQERLFLESVWATIEDAGYTRDSLRKCCPKAKGSDVGVFVGVTTNSYDLVASEEWSRGNMVPAASLPWSIANRVSYFFDFQGPSMPVDTACSSSLVAIHLACESLRRRECKLAIAGGVNLYLHPSKYRSFCQRRMVSLRGKCRSFGTGDDGFVPGEGVGAVLLKPLSKAVEDRDHIYAVVAASAFDHSGRSNGYSAPNPNSQASLIARTFESGRIHPESIGYVEGHGTGTQLGDSLEVAALSNAFQAQTDRKQFCPVGSVKANIGHGESAAGIASVAKVVLQMKYEQLVPSIHSEDVNPDIDFEHSPFYLQHQVAPWESPSTYPRRALVNSFGAGGVNACIILEEYQAHREPTAPTQDGQHLFVLSARTEDALRQYGNRLLAYLRKQDNVDLERLTFTLQVGRETMAERLAVVVSDVGELSDHLHDWIQGKPCSRVHRGSIGPRGNRPGVLDSPEPSVQTRDLNELVETWCAGRSIDWEQLYPEEKPLRLPLPTYPFIKERYWVSDSPPSGKRTVPKTGIARLHPLLSYNSSTMASTSLTSVLSDGEYYALDHKVNGEATFPGAGFLEIACMAGNIAAERKVCGIKDVIWAHPLTFNDGPKTVRTFLTSMEDSTEYEIVSIDEDNERIVHSEGKLYFQSAWGGALQAESPASIPELQKGYSRHRNAPYYYSVFKRFGLDYGRSFQTIREYYSDGVGALSRLELPDHLRDAFDQYILHPSIIDAAFQTVAGLIEGLEPGVPYLPFALDEVEIIRPVPNICYAHVASPAASGKQNTGLRKFNLELLSTRGYPLVKLNGLYLRARAGVPTRPNDDERSHHVSGV